MRLAPASGHTAASGPVAVPGWYAVKTTTGHVGLVLHHGAGPFDLGSGYGTVTQAVGLGQAADLPHLIQTGTPAIRNALARLGANPKQVESFMVQADTAAGKQQGHPAGGLWGFVTGLVGATPFVPGKQTTQLLFSTAGKPSASSGQTPVSTTPSGDVQSVAASAAVPSMNLGGIAIRVLEAVGAVLLLVLGLHAMLGGENIVTAAGAKAAKAAML